VRRPETSRHRLAIACVVGLAWTSSGQALRPSASAGGSQDQEPVVLAGAGDIANCELGTGAAATARVLDRIPGTVFTAGDNAYPSGTAKQYQECYEPTWGRHKTRTRPAPGNHDYLTNKAAPYFDYFGERAGPDRRGYYSYTLGAWHIVSLNSAIPADGRSPQIQWLRRDLADNPTACTLAYWHIPVFSSGAHGSDAYMDEAWRVLYEFGGDVVINGHDHDYERFAPQDPKGKADPVRGIREFVVGTGGGGVYKFKSVQRNSEVRNYKAYGVIKLTLGATDYAWEFVQGAGDPFRDSGVGQCVQ
jgi:calcineurin-like phosphoesterase family protein